MRKPRLTIIVPALLILILGGIWIHYRWIYDREAVLRSDLRIMRDAIDHYTMDKEAAPQSLDDLLNPQTRYLREIPVDPITCAKDWQVEMGDTILSPDQTNTGIVNLHSNSNEISSERTPYSSW